MRWFDTREVCPDCGGPLVSREEMLRIAGVTEGGEPLPWYIIPSQTIPVELLCRCVECAPRRYRQEMRKFQRDRRHRTVERAPSFRHANNCTEWGSVWVPEARFRIDVILDTPISVNTPPPEYSALSIAIQNAAYRQCISTFDWPTRAWAEHGVDDWCKLPDVELLKMLWTIERKSCAHQELLDLCALETKLRRELL